MSYVIDQEQTEIRSLKDALDWVEKEVLEIGCGDGRLARRVADLYASVTAIDPDEDLVKAAAKNPVKPDQHTIRYCVSDGRRLPFAPEAFDMVVFGWSL
jgi:ubiquinone/menaquinone biosynthesis C-methylase UbiE